MSIHTLQGYPTYIEVDAETGRTEVTFDFKHQKTPIFSPSSCATFSLASKSL